MQINILVIINIVLFIKNNYLIFRSHSKITSGSSSPRPPAPTPTEDTQNESDVINNNDGNSIALTAQT